MEQWAFIAWYEWLYEISSLWSVRRDGKLRKLWLGEQWYYTVWLSKKSKVKTFTVHRLVAQAFIPNSLNLSQVNHKNWIRSDNNIDNLEWCTNQYNALHWYRILWRRPSYNRLWMFWKDNPCSKKVWQYALDGGLIKERGSTMDVQRELWYDNGHISACCLHKKGFVTSHWYKWEYMNAVKHDQKTIIPETKFYQDN